MMRKLSVLLITPILLFILFRPANATVCIPSHYDLNIYITCEEYSCTQNFFTEQIFMKGLCGGETRTSFQEHQILDSHLDSLINEQSLDNGIFKITLKEYCPQANYKPECVRFDLITKISNDTSQASLDRVKNELQNLEQEQIDYFSRLERKEVISHLIHFFIFMILPLMVVLIMVKKRKNYFLTVAAIIIFLAVQKLYQLFAFVSITGYKELPLVESTQRILEPFSSIIIKIEVLILIYLILFQILKIQTKISSKRR